MLCLKSVMVMIRFTTSVMHSYSSVSKVPEVCSSQEVQILDYRTQQYRILPYLAQSFVFLFAATEVKDLYMRVFFSLFFSVSLKISEIFFF